MRFPRDPWQFVRPHVQQHVLEVGALPAVPREGAGGRDRGGGAARVPNLGANFCPLRNEGFEGTYLPIRSARR